MRSKKIFIEGMHCSSCEKLLEEEIGNIPGVKKVKIDRKTDSAEVYYGEAVPDLVEIKDTAGKFGYRVFESRSQERKSISEENRWLEWFNAALIVTVILFLWRIFQGSDFFNDFALKGSEITFGVSFLVGLIASVSSCLVVVGAVVIAFSEKYRSEEGSFFGDALRPNLLFHSGRLLAFFSLGGFLGAIGGEINISGNFISAYMILIALVMGWLGLNILGVLPSISALGIAMPRFLTKHWDGMKRSEHKLAPFLLGGLSFFLPCGFTQSMQLFALASGSFLTGGLSLLLFALGTVPSLLVLGVTASWGKARKFVLFQKVAGITILIFAIYTMNSGIALKGVKSGVISLADGKKQTQEENAVASPESPDSTESEQVVKMSVTNGGFDPSVIKIKQGIPVKWIINGKNVSGCTSTIIVPNFNISKNLKYGENIVQFTPPKKGEVPFSCGMGMVRGKFIVD